MVEAHHPSEKCGKTSIQLVAEMQAEGNEGIPIALQLFAKVSL